MPADYLNRGQVAQMLYDALVTPISSGADEQMEMIVKAIIEEKGGTIPNEAEDTYLERNFEVSSQMYFQIVATENYKESASETKAEKGFFHARELSVICDFQAYFYKVHFKFALVHNPLQKNNLHLYYTLLFTY
jgi:hypothetical protein